MFTDMVGFSALAQANEAKALELLDTHNRILRPIFGQHRGREIKTVGDAFLVEFGSALDAARCAVEIQEKLHEHNGGLADDERIRIRIGLHVGDVVQSEGDVLGDAVNIASRIQPLAEPGGICLTQQVYDQVQNKVSNRLVRLAPVALKNIRSPVAVYRLIPSWESAFELRPLREPAAGRTLAVLPLSNISPDPNDEYFADGLTEELISVLSQQPGLNVIARTSVTQYKSSPKPVVQVGQELGADTVLEGSVRKAGNRIRISLQLIDAPSQRHLWTSTFNREIDDVFSVQTEIADQTAKALRPTLAPAPRPEAKRRPTANPAAYDAYLRGLVVASQDEVRDVGEAIRNFELATKLDPGFAEAYAAWANFYVRVAGSYLSFREVMPKALELAAKALALDPDSSDAHATLANIYMQSDHDWERAEAEFTKALELNPNNATAHSFLALLLMSQGRFEEAKEVYRRTILLDPRGHHRRGLSWAEIESGNFEAGIRMSIEEQQRYPTSTDAHTYLGLYYAAAGRFEDARKEADSAPPPTEDEERFDLAILRAVVGETEPAREVLAAALKGELKTYLNDGDLATLYAALGEREKALDLLEKDSSPDGDQIFWLYYRGVFFDSIRNDPRFQALLKKFRLPSTSSHRPHWKG